MHPLTFPPMDPRDSAVMRSQNLPVVEGTRAIIIEQAMQSGDQATAAELLARLLRRWRPAVAIALVAGVTVGAWDHQRAGSLQSVSFTVVRPTFETPSLPGAADIAKALNNIPSPEWNVAGGRGKLEARTEKATSGVELVFMPRAADDSASARCRSEAERIVGEVNALLEPDLQRAKLTIDATISALDASIAETSTLAKGQAGASPSPGAVLLLRQVSDLRERQASQRVARDSLQGVRILGGENIVRKASFASPPITGLLAGLVAFPVALFVLSFAADVAAARRADRAQGT